jgi:hypothetical protein
VANLFLPQAKPIFPSGILILPQKHGNTEEYKSRFRASVLLWQTFFCRLAPCPVAEAMAQATEALRRRAGKTFMLLWQNILL